MKDFLRLIKYELKRVTRNRFIMSMLLCFSLIILSVLAFVNVESVKYPLAVYLDGQRIEDLDVIDLLYEDIDDMNVVYEYAHNVIAMKDGMVAYSGSTVDLFSNEQLLNHLSLAAPRVVSFANELNKKGFSTDPKLIKNMDDLVDSIVKEMKL